MPPAIFPSTRNQAIPSTPQGWAPDTHVVITISAEENKEKIVVMVNDTGEGISKADQLLIFDHFHQVKRQQQEQQGTGLGLAITRNLVELHGGRIWIESTPGRGSSFFFTLFRSEK